jgi:DNA-binding transcriptional MerR regulator
MLSIGDFSQLGQVSVRTLRLYDEINLFKPARVDRFTGYRYYAIDQLPRLNRILMLKDLGLSLEQIARLLKDNLSADQLRGMLSIKQAEIEQELQESRARLERVEARLKQIEQEGRLTNYDVILKKVEPQRIVSVRQVVSSISAMYQYRCTLFNAIYRWLEQNRIEPAGLELAVYHNAEFTEQDIDMEAAVVADSLYPKAGAPTTSTGNEVIIRELPGAQTMASIIHQGRPQDVGQAMVSLYSWIGENDYSTSGPYREIHLYGRELDLKNYDPVTIEMQIPVRKNPD